MPFANVPLLMMPGVVNNTKLHHIYTRFHIISVTKESTDLNIIVFTSFEIIASRNHPGILQMPFLFLNQISHCFCLRCGVKQILVYPREETLCLICFVSSCCFNEMIAASSVSESSDWSLPHSRSIQTIRGMACGSFRSLM